MSYELPPRRRRVNRLKRRYAETVPRRREADPVRRRRERDHRKNNSNALLAILAAALFLSCALNVYSLRTANHFGSVGLIALTAAAPPLLAIAAMAFVLYGPFSWVMGTARTSRRSPGRSAISEEHFCDISEAHGIRPRIATQAYPLLLPHYRRKMRTRLDDRLREDLHLNDTQISDLLVNLLHKTDRRPRMGAPSVFATTLDLLRYVQDAPRAFLHRSGIYEISQGQSFLRPNGNRTMKSRRSHSDSLPAFKRVVSIADDAFFRSRNKPATFHDIDSQY